MNALEDTASASLLMLSNGSIIKSNCPMNQWMCYHTSCKAKLTKHAHEISLINMISSAMVHKTQNICYAAKKRK